MSNHEDTAQTCFCMLKIIVDLYGVMKTPELYQDYDSDGLLKSLQSGHPLLNKIRLQECFFLFLSDRNIIICQCTLCRFRQGSDLGCDTGLEIQLRFLTWARAWLGLTRNSGQVGPK